MLFPLAVQIKAFNLVFKIFDEYKPKTTRAKFNHSKKHLFEPPGEKAFWTTVRDTYDSFLSKFHLIISQNNKMHVRQAHLPLKSHISSILFPELTPNQVQ